MKSFLAPLGRGFNRWIFKQDTSTVVLFLILGFLATGVYSLPGLFSRQADRFERVVDKVCAAFKEDQERDQAFQTKLLEKITADQRRDADNLAARP